MHLMQIDTQPQLCRDCDEPAFYENSDLDGPIQEAGAVFCKQHGDIIIAEERRKQRERLALRSKGRLENMRREYYQHLETIREVEPEYQPPFSITE